MQAEKAYVAFLEHQNELWKSEQDAQKAENIAKKWCWKDWMILVQFYSYYYLMVQDHVSYMFVPVEL
jgi:hypothetical protein